MKHVDTHHERTKLRRHVTSLVTAVTLAAMISVSAVAQTSPDNRPYDDKLLRLSEILGAVHYLRELCGAREGQTWRQQMRRIIELEGNTAIRRAKLVQGFNKGYRGYRRTYRTCTEPAMTAIDRFMNEGAALAEVMVKENQ